MTLRAAARAIGIKALCKCVTVCENGSLWEHRSIGANQLPLSEKQHRDELVGWADGYPCSWKRPLFRDYLQRALKMKANNEEISTHPLWWTVYNNSATQSLWAMVTPRHPPMPNHSPHPARFSFSREIPFPPRCCSNLHSLPHFHIYNPQLRESSARPEVTLSRFKLLLELCDFPAV